MPDYYPTMHAVESMSEREVDWATVLWVLAAPEVVYRNTSGDSRQRKQVNQRGTLYVVTAIEPTFDRHDEGKVNPLFAVITVGLRSTMTWNNQDARARAVLNKEEQ